MSKKMQLFSFSSVKIIMVLVLIFMILFNSCVFMGNCDKEGFSGNVVDSEKLIEKVNEKIEKFDKLMQDMDAIKDTIDSLE